MYSTNAKIRCVPVEKKFAEDGFTPAKNQMLWFFKVEFRMEHDSHFVHKPRRKSRLCAC